MSIEPTEKSVEEQFYDETMLAVSGNDTSALNLLMGEPENPEPKQEAPAAEEEVTQETEVEDDEGLTTASSNETVPDDAADAVSTLRKQLDEAKQLEHKLKSDAGRVPGLQRKLAELDKKLAELSATNRAASPEEDAELLNTDALKVLEATDPELAKAIRDSMRQVYDTATRENINRTREVTNTFLQAQHEDVLQAEMSKLISVVPNAKEVFQSAEWHGWVNTLSPGMRGLAESDYADEVLVAMREFSNSFEQPNKPTSPALAEQRSKRLQTVNPGSTKVTPVRDAEMDEMAVFNKIYTDLLAQNKRR